MKLMRYYIICIALFAGLANAHAQLNTAEKILLDPLSIYPEYGFLTDKGYVIGGEERSCNIATIWILDRNFNVTDKKQLIHDFYGISQVLDMKLTDTSIQVMTLQLESDDVVGDAGIKYYELSPSLEILDSLFLPEPSSGNVINQDSIWIFRSIDSLLRISAGDGSIQQKVRMDYSSNPLIRFHSRIVSWKDSMIFVIDSVLNIDTINIHDKVLDIATSENDVYALTPTSVLVTGQDDAYSVIDSFSFPGEARRILYHPYLEDVVVFTNRNGVYYYDVVSLRSDGMVQLFYDPVYEEDLNYFALKDGSIMRLGTTLIKKKIQNSVMYGQEFGFIHRFDQEYSEDFVSRSNISLKELSLFDTYYGSEPKFILGDTTYIITKDPGSELKWKISNKGQDTIHSTLVATNSIWGFNCAVGFNSRFYHDITFLPGDSLESKFNVYKNSDSPEGYTLKRFVCSAYPNNHYDMDFSDNLKSFKLRFILSSTDDGPDPHDIQLYPNPANNEIHIISESNLTIGKAELLDIQGKLCIQTRIDHPRSDVRFNISSVPEGLYLLRLQTSAGYAIKKLAVMR